MQLGRASRQTCHMWNRGFPSGVWQGRSDPGPSRSQTMRKEREVAPARLRARGAFLPESRSTFQCFTTFGYSSLPFTTTYYSCSHLSLPLLFSSTCVSTTALPASGSKVRYFATPPTKNDHLFPKRVRIDPTMPLLLGPRQHHPCLASPVLRNHEAQMGHLLLSSPQTHPKH